MSESLVDGQLFSNVTKPRTFRDAWEVVEGVVEVNIAKARTIKAEKLTDQRNNTIARKQYRADVQALIGRDNTANLAEVALYSAPPNQAGVELMRAAQTVEELKAITLDDFWPPV